MSGWQIVPEGINSVLQNTQEALTSLTTALSGVGENVVQGVVDAAGNDGIVAGALIAFMDDQSAGSMTFIANTAQVTLEATAAAASAFIAGDEAMAIQSLSAAGSVVEPGAVSGF